jgi:hypothetical protein
VEPQPIDHTSAARHANEIPVLLPLSFVGFMDFPSVTAQNAASHKSFCIWDATTERYLRLSTGAAKPFVLHSLPGYHEKSTPHRPKEWIIIRSLLADKFCR